MWLADGFWMAVDGHLTVTVAEQSRVEAMAVQIDAIRSTAERAMGQVRSSVNEGLRSTGTESSTPSASAV